MIIGPSLGWSFAFETTYPSEQEIRVSNFGASAIEQVYIFQDPVRIRVLSDFRAGSPLETFDYRSLHLPDYIGDENSELLQKASRFIHREIRGIRNIMKRQGKLVEQIMSVQNPRTALIHPIGLPPEYIAILLEGGVPLAIENMDRNKKEGIKIGELEALVREFELGFVLDAQHAYEQDPSMHYAMDLLQAIKDKIVHYHVSGQRGEDIHAPVCKAENKGAIIDFMSKAFSVKKRPIILEGSYKFLREISEDVNFLKEELRGI